MLKYTFQIENPQSQYIQLTLTFTATTTIHEIQLPAWRPGRYELGNFAKNVRNFNVFSLEGELIPSEKITKDRWKINTKEGKTYHIRYEYYAAELNAGSTFLSAEQLYVNPVNCCVYIEGMQDLACEIFLELPTDYQIACSLEKVEKHHLKATNFDELADSPWIASSTLQHYSYTVQNVIFHLWFQGECKIDSKKIISDFERFTNKQVEQFGAFPFSEYHFLFQLVLFDAYHGVEHKSSTVIYLGPSYSLFDSNYTELLGVSSHELYHAWNVKSIRPIEMYPYDFTKENYSKLGYLCEGVTTYMGDIMLFRSRVFSLKEYTLEFNKQLQKHVDNFARFSNNVADSSFDTWLDGYVSGAPGRKVSIYTEGCLLAFMVDVSLLYHTQGKERLDSVMKKLYEDFYLQNKGVSEDDFWSTIRYFIGDKLDILYSHFYHGSADFEEKLIEIMPLIGFELHKTTSKSYSQAHLGIKTTLGKTGQVVSAVYPNSSSFLSGLMIGDEIIGVNSIFSQNKLDEWLHYFKDEVVQLTILRGNKIQEITLQKINQEYYRTYTIRELKEKTSEQQYLFEKWKS
jgi:predicted metalloprotease with PDZ domain